MASEDELFYSGLGAGGRQSGRSYTAAEIAAGRRCGLINDSRKHHNLGGPMFWATGDHYPGVVEQFLHDYQLVAAALEREWGKEPLAAVEEGEKDE